MIKSFVSTSIKKGSTPLIFGEKNGDGVLIHAHTTTRSKYYCRYSSTLF